MCVKCIVSLRGVETEDSVLARGLVNTRNAGRAGRIGKSKYLVRAPSLKTPNMAIIRELLNVSGNSIGYGDAYTWRRLAILHATRTSRTVTRRH